MSELLIQTWLRGLLSSVTDSREVFPRLLDRFRVHYEQTPCHTVQQLGRRTTKAKGDFFERFCAMYLRAAHPQRFQNVWLLHEVPEDVLQRLRLRRQDVGIDLVAQDAADADAFYAVQAKYRRRNPRRDKTALPWSQLSTFYALCARTGPWHKLVVMTSCDYVRRMGRKSAQDWTMARQSFVTAPRSVWCAMAGDAGRVLLDSAPATTTTTVEHKTPPSLTELRRLRSHYFGSST